MGPNFLKLSTNTCEKIFKFILAMGPWYLWAGPDGKEHGSEAW